MKRYMLDTDTSSYIIKNRPAHVAERFRTLKMEQLCISVITYAELLYGVERSSSERVNRPIIENFVAHLDVLDWDKEAADHYSRVRTQLERSGTPIGGMDMQIGSHALSQGMILVTNNTRHFERIIGLKLETWV